MNSTNTNNVDEESQTAIVNGGLYRKEEENKYE